MEYWESKSSNNAVLVEESEDGRGISNFFILN